MARIPEAGLGLSWAARREALPARVRISRLHAAGHHAAIGGALKQCIEAQLGAGAILPRALVADDPVPAGRAVDALTILAAHRARGAVVMPAAAPHTAAVAAGEGEAA